MGIIYSTLAHAYEVIEYHVINAYRQNLNNGKKYILINAIYTMIIALTPYNMIYHSLVQKSIKYFVFNLILRIFAEYLNQLIRKNDKRIELVRRSENFIHVLSVISKMPGLYRKKFIRGELKKKYVFKTINGHKFATGNVLNDSSISDGEYLNLKMILNEILSVTINIYAAKKISIFIFMLGLFYNQMKKFIDHKINERLTSFDRRYCYDFINDRTYFESIIDKTNNLEDASKSKRLNDQMKENKINSTYNIEFIKSSLWYKFDQNMNDYFANFNVGYNLFDSSCQMQNCWSRMSETYRTHKDIQEVINEFPQVDDVKQIDIKKYIDISGIDFKYTDGKFKLNQKNDLHIELGSIINVTGLNGHGKTTFYNIINGDIAKKGDPLVEFCKYKLFVDDREINEFRCLKSYMMEQVPAYENKYSIKIYLYGPKHKKLFDYEEGLIKKIMEIIGLGDKFGKNDKEILSKYAEDLNGGSLQRLRIAKTIFKIMTSDTQIIILDEPDTFIDLTFTEMMKKIFEFINYKNKIIFITSHKNSLGTKNINIVEGNF